MQIQNGVFVVTGGGSGLGAATARMLVEAGAKVVLADVNRDAGEALAAELGSAAAFALTDVTDADSGKAAIDLAVSCFGRLTGLVSCAGVAPAEKVVGREAPISFAYWSVNGAPPTMNFTFFRSPSFSNRSMTSFMPVIVVVSSADIPTAFASGFSL